MAASKAVTDANMGRYAMALNTHEARECVQDCIGPDESVDLAVKRVDNDVTVTIVCPARKLSPETRRAIFTAAQRNRFSVRIHQKGH